MMNTLSKQRRAELLAFTEKLGVRLDNLELLNQALRHSSYCNENGQAPYDSNERLEFLGDTVLEVIISQLLYERYPQATEGQLSRARASAVNESRLADTAARLGLGDYLLLGRGEELHGGASKPSLLANAFEAVAAAIYLDQGLETARRFLLPLLGDVALASIDRPASKDYKTRLQEKVQAEIQRPPRYRVAKTEGPEHDKVFHVIMEINGQPLVQGKGKSKKDAEQDAARQGLEDWPQMQTALANPEQAEGDEA